MRTDPPARRLAATRIKLRATSQAMTSTTLGKKWPVGLSMKMRPASKVTQPAATANGLVSRRSSPASASIVPAANSSAPMTSEPWSFPAAGQQGARAQQDDRHPGERDQPGPIAVRGISGSTRVAMLAAPGYGAITRSAFFLIL